MRESKRALELTIGRTVRAFAYPYGDLGPATARLAESAGFDLACTTEEGCVTARSRSLRAAADFCRRLGWAHFRKAPGRLRPLMAEPLVTCIVIFLDEERFLAEAIDSVRAQTLPVLGDRARRRRLVGPQHADRPRLRAAFPGPHPLRRAPGPRDPRHERGAQSRARARPRPVRRLPRCGRHLGTQQAAGAGRTPRHAPRRRHGLRSHAALAQLARRRVGSR